MNVIRVNKLSTNCLNILKKTDIQVAIFSSSRITDFTLLQTPADGDVTWSLYCLTEPGDLYRVDECHVDAFLGKRRGTAIHQDDGIFSDLLDDGFDNNGIQLEVSTTPVYILQPCDIIYKDTDVPIGLCVTCDFVALSKETGAQFVTDIFRNEDTCNTINLSKNMIRHLVLPKQGIDKFNERTEKLILMKVVIADLINPGCTISSDCVKIGDTLFKQLFGQDSALLGSPVLLIGPSEGSLYYVPIKSHVANFSQPFIQSQPIQTSRMTEQSEWVLLCQTSSNVCDITSMVLAEEQELEKNHLEEISNEQITQDVLVICDSNGLVQVYHADASNLNCCGPLLSRIPVCQPVIAVSSYYNKLYHSSGECLYENTMKIVTEKSRHVNNKDIQRVISDTKAILHAGVVSTTARVHDDYVDSKDSPCLLSCVTKNNNVKELNPSDKDYQDAQLATGGERIKDVLVAIDGVDAKRAELKSQLQLQDYWLKQVNIAAYLLRLNVLNTVTSSEQGNSITKMHSNNKTIPFTCSCRAMLLTGERENQVMLDCILTNQMPYSLSHDWTFVLSFIPPKTIKDIAHFSKSLNLRNSLKPGDSITVSLPVEPSLVYSGFQLTVAAVLAIHDRTFNELAISDTIANSQECLWVPVYTENIDILYFMMPNTSVSGYKCVDVRNIGEINKIINTIADSKPASRCAENIQKDLNSESTISITIYSYIREETFKRLQQHYGRGVQCILNYIFHNSPEIKDLNMCEYNATTVLGHTVNISVYDVSGESTRSRKAAAQLPVGIMHVEVAVRCEPEDSAAVHRAISCKLEELEITLIRPSLPVKDMTSHLHTLKEIQSELENSRESKMSLIEARRAVSSIYEKLRSIHV